MRSLGQTKTLTRVPASRRVDGDRGDVAEPIRRIEVREVDRVVERTLLELGEHQGSERVQRPVAAPDAGRVPEIPHRIDGEAPELVLVIVQGQADLLEVVDALDPPRRLAGRLDGRQQQGDQDRDDRDHHQQFDQREGRSSSRHRSSPS